jgi:hypothetical protein
MNRQSAHGWQAARRGGWIGAHSGQAENNAAVALAATATSGDRYYPVSWLDGTACEIGRDITPDGVQDADIFMTEEHRERVIGPVPLEYVMIGATHAGEFLPDDHILWTGRRQRKLVDFKLAVDL